MIVSVADLWSFEITNLSGWFTTWRVLYHCCTQCKLRLCWYVAWQCFISKHSFNLVQLFCLITKQNWNQFLVVRLWGFSCIDPDWLRAVTWPLGHAHYLGHAHCLRLGLRLVVMWHRVRVSVDIVSRSTVTRDDASVPRGWSSIVTYNHISNVPGYDLDMAHKYVIIYRIRFIITKTERPDLINTEYVSS